MTLTIHLSEAEEALLQQAAEQANSTGEELVRRAVKAVIEEQITMPPVAGDAQEFRQWLAELREVAEGVPNLPDSALQPRIFLRGLEALGSMDARLMQVLTFDVIDFVRFSQITAVHPSEFMESN